MVYSPIDGAEGVDFLDFLVLAVLARDRVISFVVRGHCVDFFGLPLGVGVEGVGVEVEFLRSLLH